MQSPVLAAALDYLSRGWSVLPLCPPNHEGAQPGHIKDCKRPGKQPLYAWKTYQQRRPSKNEVNVLFKRNPHCNIGVICGAVSGLVGIDADGPNATALLQEMGPTPPTLHFLTPGGGLRLFYKIPAEVKVPKRHVSQGDSHVIVLGEGSYTVMPPSRHVSGGTYGPLAGELAEAPDWLLMDEVIPGGDQGLPGFGLCDGLSNTPDAPLAATDKLIRARAYLHKCEPCIEQQGGSAKAFKIACKLVHGFHLSVSEALELVLAHYNQKCQPPWSVAEWRHKLSDALTKGHAEDMGPAKATATQDGIMTADVLLEQQFPEIKWAVAGLVPEGASLLAGRPKTGKSWLVQQIALGVANGQAVLGREVPQPGPVLYLALEDGQRRLQRRLKKVLDGMHADHVTNLHVATEWKRLGEGGIAAIEAWLDKHPIARLVIVDTLARVRDKRVGDVSLYEEDYEAVTILQKLAMRRGVAVVIVTHTRKPKNANEDDPLDEVQSSTGITAAADVVLVLKRARYAREGKLFVTGRDVDEKLIPLMWSPQECVWEAGEEPDENDPEAFLSYDQKRVIAIIKEAGHALSILDINAKLHKEYTAAAQLIKRMKDNGLLVKEGYARYNVPPPPMQQGELEPES